jgi:ArsR family transcriptional regulator
MPIDVEVRVPTAALKALAEPRRWRIVELLSCEELCVCHLAEEVGVPQPLVESEKHRQWTYYRLRPGALEQIRDDLGAITSCCPTPGERRRPCE